MSVASLQGAGGGRSHRRHPLRRPRRRHVSRPRRLARPLAPLHPQGRPLGRRQVLPGHPGGARATRAWWRGSPTRRRCCSISSGRRPRSGLRLHLRQHRQRFSAARLLRALHRADRALPGPPGCRRRPACWWARSRNCATPRKKARRWTWSIPRATASFRWTKPPRRRTSSSRMAGFYDIRRPNGRNELVAVNADRHESDLTPAPPETLTLWQNTASGPPGVAEGPPRSSKAPFVVVVRDAGRVGAGGGRVVAGESTSFGG